MSQTMLNDFVQNMKQTDFDTKNVFVHASYDLNLCEWNQRLRSKYIKRLQDEMAFCRKMGFSLINLYIGSSPSKQTHNKSLKVAAGFLDEVLSIIPDIQVTLENSAGFGAQLGAHLDDIAKIISLSQFSDQIGFALNTSHAFSYGYDFRTQDKYEAFINTIDDILGLNKIRLMFFNDSKSDFGACTDINKNLGLGKMNAESFNYFLSDKRLKKTPIILETPNPDLWKNEIELLNKETTSCLN